LTEEELSSPKASDDEEILHQQFLRAMSSFEGIILAQIKVKSRIGDRLNFSIRVGLGILSIVAISILVLLLTLSMQINRISDVVDGMHQSFNSVANKMTRVTHSVTAMEEQVALMSDIEQYTTIMTQEMDTITSNMNALEYSVTQINKQFSDTRKMIGGISYTIQNMNGEIQQINQGVNHMAEPAKTLNKFFPMMP